MDQGPKRPFLPNQPVIAIGCPGNSRLAPTNASPVLLLNARPRTRKLLIGGGEREFRHGVKARSSDAASERGEPSSLSRVLANSFTTSGLKYSPSASNASSKTERDFALMPEFDSSYVGSTNALFSRRTPVKKRSCCCS